MPQWKLAHGMQARKVQPTRTPGDERNEHASLDVQVMRIVMNEAVDPCVLRNYQLHGSGVEIAEQYVTTTKFRPKCQGGMSDIVDADS